MASVGVQAQINFSAQSYSTCCVICTPPRIPAVKFYFYDVTHAETYIPHPPTLPSNTEWERHGKNQAVGGMCQVNNHISTERATDTRRDCRHHTCAEACHAQIATNSKPSSRRVLISRQGCWRWETPTIAALSHQQRLALADSAGALKETRYQPNHRAGPKFAPPAANLLTALLSATHGDTKPPGWPVRSYSLCGTSNRASRGVCVTFSGVFATLDAVESIMSSAVSACSSKSSKSSGGMAVLFGSRGRPRGCRRRKEGDAGGRCGESAAVFIADSIAFEGRCWPGR